jgi:hypothetical protein
MKLSLVPCRGVLRPRLEISPSSQTTPQQNRDGILNDFIAATSVPVSIPEPEQGTTGEEEAEKVDENPYSHMDSKYASLVEDLGDGVAYVPSLQLVADIPTFSQSQAGAPIPPLPVATTPPLASPLDSPSRRRIAKILLACLWCLLLAIWLLRVFAKPPDPAHQSVPVLMVAEGFAQEKQLDLYALFVQPFFYFVSMVSFGIAIALISRRLFRKCVQFARTYPQPARPVVIVGVITPSSKRSIAQWVNAHAHPEARRIPEQDLEIHLTQVDESKPTELKHYPRSLPLPLNGSYVQRIRFEGRALDSLVLILTSPILIERSRDLTGKGFASAPIWIALAHDIPHASFLLADAVLPPSYVFVQLMYEYKRILYKGLKGIVTVINVGYIWGLRPFDSNEMLIVSPTLALNFALLSIQRGIPEMNVAFSPQRNETMGSFASYKDLSVTIEDS